MMAGRKRGAISRAAGREGDVGATAMDMGTRRLTVDLPGDVRDDLGVWAAQQTAQHRKSVSVAPAVRVLLGMLLEDDELSARVVERIKAGEGAL